MKVELPQNLKSDVAAKGAYVLELRRRGFEKVRIKNGPADIIAEKGGLPHYFEIKFTRQESYYFGAATLTEWEAALANPAHFWFVVAYQSKNVWQFKEYTPEEFMSFSSIPPFKIFFNVPINPSRPKSQKRIRSAINLTVTRLQKLAAVYGEFRTQLSRTPTT